MKRIKHSTLFLLISLLWTGIQLHSKKPPDFEVRRMSPGALVFSQGVESALETLNRIKSSQDDRYIINERQFNLAGFELLMEGRIDEAIALFRLNVETFPDSWNAYESLAEAYMVKGDKGLAVKYYKKSLALNPQNRNARRLLERLEKR